jgi:uncharacterized repeat protein (TIGR03803 family)
MKLQPRNLAHSLVAGSLVALCMSAPPACGQTLEVLHSFQGTDGAHPYNTAMIQGRDGNFYGTTSSGGDLSLHNGFGYGTVFKMTPAGALTTLVVFHGSDGSGPDSGGLVQGPDATGFGGDLSVNNGSGAGTIYKMTPDGTLTTLVQFDGITGLTPNKLLRGSDGELYGTTRGGGSSGSGIVFKVGLDGTSTVLANFDGRNGRPLGGLAQGSDGNFYGTTASFGPGSYGSVYSVTADGVLTTLVVFNKSNGVNPLGELVQGSDGGLYGTTPSYFLAAGTFFMITADGALNTLFSARPFDTEGWPLVLGRGGNFYGVTYPGPGSDGTVFQMTPTGTLTTLVSFPNNVLTNGTPETPLVEGTDGNLYGTTYSGGSYDNGTVFRIAIILLPRLSLAKNGSQISMSWPTNALGFTLQSAPGLSSQSNWVDVGGTPVVAGDQFVMTNAVSQNAQFYRLKK